MHILYLDSPILWLHFPVFRTEKYWFLTIIQFILLQKHLKFHRVFRLMGSFSILKPVYTEIHWLKRKFQSPMNILIPKSRCCEQFKCMKFQFQICIKRQIIRPKFSMIWTLWKLSRLIILINTRWKSTLGIPINLIWKLL